MNKSEMIDMVAEAADISKAAAGRAVDAVFEGITDSLKERRLRHSRRLWNLLC